jgi:RND family efflux transporter MFP subunit
MPEVDLTQLAIDRSPAGPPRTGARRHLLTRYVLPLGLLAGFLTLLAWAARDAILPPREVTVVPVFATQSQVQREGTPLFKAAGWIEPRPTLVRVAALAPGFVERLLVVQDQPVRAGEPIAELVKDDARLAHERALADRALREAELQEAQATLTAAQTRFEQPVHLDAAVGEAEAALAAVETMLKNLPFETQRAQARLEYAQRNHAGKSSASGTIAGRVVEEAKSELDSATALVEELQNRTGSLAKEQAALLQRRNALRTQRELLAEERQARDEAAAKVSAAQARLDQASVAQSEAKLRLDRMTVRAPIDGRIFRLVAEPGTRLMDGPGTPASDGSTVVTMYRPESLQVRVDVRFEDLPKVRLEQPVQIDNPALATPLTGRVLFVSSEADIQKNTLQVKVELDSPPPVFKPEMLVDVTFLAPPEPQQEPSEELRLYVPRPLVFSGEEGPFVWLADQSAGVARRTPVETGAATADGMVQITRGLTLASRVIATGHEQLAEGQRIRVVGEAADTAVITAPQRSHRMLNRLPTGEDK